MQKEKQTNKKNGVGWAEGEVSYLSNITSSGWAANAKPSQFSPVVCLFVTATSHAGKILVIPHIFYAQKRLPCPGLGD